MEPEMGKIRYDEEFIVNSRKLKLFTCKWVPTTREPRALIFICHGYAMECSITMHSTAVRLVEAGFAVHGMDYEGHGKSAGLQCYVANIDYLVDDCCKHFTGVCERPENVGKMRYLLGESMGGAIALLLHRKKPDFWDGAILVAPMCRIADSIRPPPFVISILNKLCQLIPTWRIIPSKDIIDAAFKVPEVRRQIRENPYCYKGWPRLKTGNELLRVSMDLERRLQEVSMPFIVLHGEDDRVTDKSVSDQLFRMASSTDKTIRLYPDMWHGLLYGETKENIDIVFRDIIKWLEERTKVGITRLETARKHANDAAASKSYL